MEVSIVVRKPLKGNYGFLSCIPVIREYFNIDTFTYPATSLSWYFIERQGKLLDQKTLDIYFTPKKKKNKFLYDVETFLKDLSFKFYFLEYSKYYEGNLKFPEELCWITSQKIENRSKESVAYILRKFQKKFKKLVIVTDKSDFKEKNQSRQYKDVIHASVYQLDKIYNQVFDSAMRIKYNSINPFLFPLLPPQIKTMMDLNDHLYDVEIRKKLMAERININILNEISKEDIDQLVIPFIENASIAKEFKKWLIRLKAGI